MAYKRKTTAEKYQNPRHKRKVLARSWAFTQTMHDASREDVINGLVEKFGYTESMANAIFANVMNRVTNRMMMEANTIYDRNLQRLENMIEDSIDDGDSAEALKAIQEQNKMIGATNKSEITLANKENEEFVVRIED